MPIRPEQNYMSKYLSRALQSPTNDGGDAKLTHATRYLKGTEDYRLSIRLVATTTAGATFHVTTYVDFDVAGRATTRKSTLGCTITVAVVVFLHYSQTQAMVALSSGEAELYALSSGTTERMTESEWDVKTNGHIVMATDSTVGESMAFRLCVSRATKHIQLRSLYIQDLVVAAGVSTLR